MAPTDRHEIIGARDLHAVTGIIEQRDVGALHLPAKTLHGDVHRALVEIELGMAADQREAERAECLRHQARILRRIVERRDVLVGGVADDKRDALLGRRRLERDGERGRDQRCQHQDAMENSRVHQ